MSVASAKSSRSKNSTGSNNEEAAKQKREKIFEIDFIGGETYRVSQNYILQKRSLEPIGNKDSLAALSARGLYHRDKEYFSKELAGSSQLIRRITKQGIAKKGGSYALFQQYFNRALAFERLKQTDRAIEDYTTAIKNDQSQSQAYFNRAGLYQVQGKNEKALKDFNQCVLLEPTNVDYRFNRSLLHRKMGDYVQAIQDTVVKRAIEVTPAALKDLGII
jgi:tetratricopeptide (TPR) repeat protein